MISDEDLLLQNSVQHNHTFIKLYLIQNYSNIELITKFQSELITKHSNDFMFITSYKHMNQHIKSSFMNLPQSAEARVITLYSYNELFALELHSLIDILQQMYLNPNNTQSTTKSLTNWFKSIILTFKFQTKHTEVYNKIIEQIKCDPQNELLQMIQNTWQYGSYKCKLNKM
eukprot:231227_1